jgi:hypothetical protein
MGLRLSINQDEQEHVPFLLLTLKQWIPAAYNRSIVPSRSFARLIGSLSLLWLHEAFSRMSEIVWLHEEHEGVST